MKYTLLIIIFFCSGLIGWIIKNKYKKQKEFLVYLNNFIEYLHVNMIVYKNNLSDIIDNYLIEQNNKNAKFGNLFQKNNNINAICKEKIKEYIYCEEINVKIKTCLSGFGLGDLLNEQEKIYELKMILKNGIDETDNDLKTKGDLYFKVWLSIGFVICIILW